MPDVDLELEEPLIDAETIEAALDKCQDAIVKAQDGGLSGFAWPLLRSSVADAVSQAAKTDKVHWLFQGWAFARELKSYKDPEQYPPDRIALLKLGEHELSGTFHPIVTISCKGAVVAKLRFDVVLTGTFNAVSISIQAGKIVACGGGDCELVMDFKFRDIDLTGPVSLKKFKLPGKLEFRTPIAIP